MDHTILLLDHRREYDTIVELRDTALYYGKLISYYGFDLDMKSGKWNIKRFPITMSGSEIEAINSDRAKFNEAVNQYNRYAEILLRLNVLSKTRKGFFVAYRPTCSNCC